MHAHGALHYDQIDEGRHLSPVRAAHPGNALQLHVVTLSSREDVHLYVPLHACGAYRCLKTNLYAVFRESRSTPSSSSLLLMPML